MNDTSGPTSETPSTRCDPASSCWRTSPGTSVSAAGKLSDRLPNWGTACAGEWSELPTPALLTAARDGSAPQLLPTPAVNDMGAGKTVQWWDEWAPRQKASDGTTAPHGKSLHIEILRYSDLTPRQ